MKPLRTKSAQKNTAVCVRCYSNNVQQDNRLKNVNQYHPNDAYSHRSNSLSNSITNSIDCLSTLSNSTTICLTNKTASTCCINEKDTSNECYHLNDNIQPIWCTPIDTRRARRNSSMKNHRLISSRSKSSNDLCKHLSSNFLIYSVGRQSSVIHLRV